MSGRPLLKLGIGVVGVLALLVIGFRFGSGVNVQGRGTISVSDINDSNAHGSMIYFLAMFGNETYLKKIGAWHQAERRLKMAQPFVLDAGTHMGTIRGLTLNDRLFLMKGGMKYPASGKPLLVSTHHDMYLVFFPRFDMQGKPMFEDQTGSFKILIELGSVQDPDLPEHSLTFHYPVGPVKAEGGGEKRLTGLQMAMLLGGAMAALLVSCTPCLIGSMAVGALTVGTAWNEEEGKEALAKARRGIAKKAVAYLASVVGAYLTVAVVVNVFKLKIENLRPVELIGGLILLVIGLSLLRGWGPVARLEHALLGLLVRKFPGLRRFVNETVGLDFGVGSSTAMGASLAMVCSAAGAPALSTSVILPLLVYAGINNLSYALGLLVIYLAVCAVPFLLIAVGLGEYLLTASIRFHQSLLVANAFLLIGLGAMLMASPERVADYLSVPARIALAPLRWL